MQRVLLIGALTIIVVTGGFFAFKAFEYRAATRFFEEAAGFTVGENLSTEQIRTIDSQPCRSEGSSQNERGLGSKGTVSTKEMGFQCRVHYLGYPGLKSRTLLFNFVLKDTTLLSKSALIFYDNNRAIGVTQRVRELDYAASPDPSNPNRRYEVVKYSDVSTKSAVLTEDDTVSVEHRRKDWNLNLWCLWNGRNCVLPEVQIEP